MKFKKTFNKKIFIIAEIGSNFDQDIKKAYKLIDVAKSCGADAVKFQLFKAEKLYPKNSPLYKVFKSIELKSSWITKIKNYSQKKKIIFFASAFDQASIKKLIRHRVKILKIASSEIVKLHEICYAASFKIPILISTGMADLADIAEAVEACKNVGNNQIVLLHTSSLYPTSASDVNLLNMVKLSKIFNLPVGFSDHSLGNTAAIAAVSLGAKVIEKHITLDKNSNGPDHFYAAEPAEFKGYVKAIRQAEKILGNDLIKINPKVKLNARRKSIFVSQNVKKNQILSIKNLKIKTDARGIETRFLKNLYGFKFSSNIKKENPLHWKYINFKK